MSRAAKRAQRTSYIEVPFVHPESDRLAELAIADLPEPMTSRTQHVRYVIFKASWLVDNFDSKIGYDVTVKCRLMDPIVREGIQERPLCWGVTGMFYLKRASDGAPKSDIDGDVGSPTKAEIEVSQHARKLMSDNGLTASDVLEAQADPEAVQKITVPMVKALVEAMAPDVAKATPES